MALKWTATVISSTQRSSDQKKNHSGHLFNHFENWRSFLKGVMCWITFLHQPATPLNPVVGLPAHVVPPLDRMTLFCSSLLQSERSLESVARSRQESLSSIEEDDYDTLDDIHSDKNIVRTKVRENHFSCLRMAQMWLSAHLAYLEWKDLWMCKVVLTSSTSGY